jgi:hypothetical protein
VIERGDLIVVSDVEARCFHLNPTFSDQSVYGKKIITFPDRLKLLATSPPKNARRAAVIAGLPGHPIEDLLLQNISLGFEGGCAMADTERRISEQPDAYPDAWRFGTLPAYCLYCRHVKDLRFDNVTLPNAAADQRHALMLHDAEDVTIGGRDLARRPTCCCTLKARKRRTSCSRRVTCNWSRRSAWPPPACARTRSLKNTEVHAKSTPCGLKEKAKRKLYFQHSFDFLHLGLSFVKEAGEIVGG